MMRLPLIHRAIRWWESFQVELNGQYSVERFTEFHAFSQKTSRCSIASRCVSTPLPCITILLLLEILPLEPPTQPWRESPIYWTRVFVVSLVVAVGLLEYFRHQVPDLKLSTFVVWSTACLGTTLGVALMTMWSDVIGHPLPFSILLGAPLCVNTMATIVLFRVRNQLRADARFRKDLIDHANIGHLRIVLTLVYPGYVFLLRKLHGVVQTAFIMLLPLVKIAVKNVMARVLGDRDDIKPEAVGFNLEVFHALFIAYSIQSATDGGAIYLIVFKDFFLAWITLRDVNHVVNQLVHACDCTSDSFSRDGLVANTEILLLAARLHERDSEIRQHRWLRRTTWHADSPDRVVPTTKPVILRLHSTASTPWFRPTAVGPSPPTATVSPKSKRSLRPTVHETHEEVVRRTLRLMYLIEFIVLVEYVEVIVPFIFNTYMVCMFYLPNREYYPMLKAMSDKELHKSVVNVSVYTLQAVVSFTMISAMLWWRLRISSFHVLGFVLTKQWAVVQCGMIIWVTFVVQTTVEHFGFDYTFRFAWLHKDEKT